MPILGFAADGKPTLDTVQLPFLGKYFQVFGAIDLR
jgi:hypothetical protein